MFITAALRERGVQKTVQAILNSSNDNKTDPQNLQEVPHICSEDLFHRWLWLKLKIYHFAYIVNLNILIKTDINQIYQQRSQ